MVIDLDAKNPTKCPTVTLNKWTNPVDFLVGGKWDCTEGVWLWQTTSVVDRRWGYSQQGSSPIHVLIQVQGQSSVTHFVCLNVNRFLSSTKHLPHQLY